MTAETPADFPGAFFIPRRAGSMANQDAQAVEAARKRAGQYVIEQFKRGVPPDAIIAQLTQNGLEAESARTFVTSIHAELLKETEREQLTTGTLLVAFAAAVVAALVGGAIWGGIVLLTEYEVGFMATGIGLLSGYAVTFFSEKKGPPLQVIAVLSALGGILAGKYFTFFLSLKDFIKAEYGAAAASQVGIFSGDVARIFREAISDLFSPYDLLWIVLAIVAAWGIPRAVGAKRMKLGTS